MSLQAVGSYLNLNEKVTVPHSLAGPAAPTSLFRSPSPAESSLLVRSARALRLDGISTVTRNLNFVARLDLPNLNSELKARASVTRILRLLRPLAGRRPGMQRTSTRMDRTEGFGRKVFLWLARRPPLAHVAWPRIHGFGRTISS